jgi:hypothetical protein
MISLFRDKCGMNTHHPAGSFVIGLWEEVIGG